jgi:hypothetical protein
LVFASFKPADINDSNRDGRLRGHRLAGGRHGQPSSIL